MATLTGLFKTRFAAALLVFSMAAAGAGYLGFAGSKALDFPFLSWTAWTIKDFFKQEQKPNVVFLGSSLMLVPLDGIDADYLDRRVDGSQHHHSAYFEDKFKEKTGINTRTFTFALPGEMPSDAYLIVNNMLKGEKKPDVIVYGVGPRDFLDNMLPSPSATDPFRFLSRFGDISPVADRVMPEWQDRLDFELGKACYFYGKRVDLVNNAAKAATAVINTVLPLPANTKAASFDDRRLLMPDFRPCEVLQGQAYFRPVKGDQRGNFVDNLDEYKKRYKKMKWETYISQMRFFADTIDTANARGIKFVVVTMPITGLNRSLLSNIAWDAYRSGVIGMAKAKGATVIDFSESPEFSQDDFGDTVHLHSHGGKRFFDLLMDRLALEQSLLSVLQSKPERERIAQKEKGGQL